MGFIGCSEFYWRCLDFQWTKKYIHPEILFLFMISLIFLFFNQLFSHALQWDLKSFRRPGKIEVPKCTYFLLWMFGFRGGWVGQRKSIRIIGCYLMQDCIGIIFLKWTVWNRWMDGCASHYFTVGTTLHTQKMYWLSLPMR